MQPITSNSTIFKPSITFKNVSKEFFLQTDRTFKELIPNIISGGKWANKHKVFDNLSFTINAGETVGIVGKNGAGKSTTLKLIAGVTYPTIGSVEVVGKIAPLIELGAGFNYDLNGYENIYLNSAILGLHKKEIEQVKDEIIAFSELTDEFLQAPLKRYSTGMVMRLAFSVAMYVKADIFLVDEVLAVGDAPFQKKSLAKLRSLRKEENRIIVFVTHDKKSVISFCDRCLLLDKGSLVADGDPKEVFTTYNMRMKNLPLI